MMTYVLEASSLLRYIDSEEGGARVAELLQASGLHRARVIISAVNWGEVFFILLRRKDASRAAGLDREFSASLQIIPATGAMAAEAAAARLSYDIPYADCFGLQLASQNKGSTLVTADFDYVSAMQVIAIEFLPPKPKP